MIDILMDEMRTLQLGGHIVALRRLLHRFFRILLGTLNLWWETGREFVLWGDQPLGSQFLGLFRIVTTKNLPISSILRSTFPFSQNFNFRYNLSNSEIEELESLMSSLTCLHLTPSILDVRTWFLSSLRLFTVKSFFLVLSHLFDSYPTFPTNFVWKSQVSFKVKSFVWLVVHKKVNTNNMLQLRRPYKALSLDIYKLCMEYRESIDHLFLHCPLTMGL